MRTYTLHRRLYELFQLRTIPTATHLARAVGSSVVLHLRCQWPPSVHASLRGTALAFAWPLGQYLGGLSAIKGWKTPRSRIV
jgi:hypothetical protein